MQQEQTVQMTETQEIAQPMTDEMQRAQFVLNGVAFNPFEHLRLIKTKHGMQTYLDAKWRIAWARAVYGERIRFAPEIVEHNRQDGYALVKCSIYVDDKLVAEEYGSEERKDFEDYLEKALTKSKGRALADIGFGTQFAAELDNGVDGNGKQQEMIADAPVEQRRYQQQRQQSSNGAQAANTRQNPAPQSRSPQTIQTPPPAPPAQSDSIAPSAEVLQEEVARLRIVAKDGSSIGWKEVVRKALNIHNKADLQSALSRQLTEQERRAIDATIQPFRPAVASS
jgi:hypothetical protein